jgi:hypothetical protein
MEVTGRYYEPVFQFLDRKRAEGKPYLVYMTADMNKFLRIYYARVKAVLADDDDDDSRDDNHV